MKFMQASEEPAPNHPSTSAAMPVLGEGNANTGIASEAADMQGTPTQGDSQKECLGQATSSGNLDGSRHARERAIKRQGEELSEEWDRATNYIREEPLVNKRVIEERELPEQGQRSRHMTIDQNAHL